MRLLISGFEPFGDHGRNPTEGLLRLLPRRVEGCEIDTILLPVEFARAGALLTAEVDHLRPDAVLSLGLAASREAISVERIAVNCMDARIPDNAGFQPQDVPIVAGGPAAYFATIPPRRIMEAIRTAGYAAELSASAGLYVCNCVYYALLHHEMEHNHAYHSLFIHVPIQSDETLKNAIVSAIKAIVSEESERA